MEILRRKKDNTLWTPAGDCMFPLTGFNFVKAKKKTINFWIFKINYWVKDKSERWIFYNTDLMEWYNEI